MAKEMNCEREKKLSEIKEKYIWQKHGRHHEKSVWFLVNVDSVGERANESRLILCERRTHHDNAQDGNGATLAFVSVLCC